jgi:hypothetical protein
MPVLRNARGEHLSALRHRGDSRCAVRLRRPSPASPDAPPAGRALEQSHWRYRELLPIGAECRAAGALRGRTPLTPAAPWPATWACAKLFLKDDGRNATGSLKDRASSVGVVKAREKRRPIIACASTGNAASSCAGHGGQHGDAQRHLRAGTRAGAQGHAVADLRRDGAARARQL